MAKILLFSLLSLLLLLLSRSTTVAAAWPVSDPQPPESPTPATPWSWDSSINEDDCEGLETECSARRMAIAHTDYIYTQDIKDP
ncbi:phytosulfokines-like [Magnolia sinica]|uniref:phytosulfokines-like n=1 Tax=Magnolia sinica TaxID=86752 RepID=UPI002657B579|nr:phytosulfokines-like [Magnolia sinica]